MEASVEASMEDMEDREASTVAISTEASMKASTKALMEVMETFVDVMKASMDVTSMEA